MKIDALHDCFSTCHSLVFAIHYYKLWKLMRCMIVPILTFTPPTSLPVILLYLWYIIFLFSSFIDCKYISMSLLIKHNKSFAFPLFLFQSRAFCHLQLAPENSHGWYDEFHNYCCPELHWCRKFTNYLFACQ